MPPSIWTDSMLASDEKVGIQPFNKFSDPSADSLNFEDLCAEIDHDPLRGAKLARRRETSVRIREYEGGASAVAIAIALARRPDLKAQFYADEVFEGANKPNDTKLLLHCCQYIRGARTGPDGHRAGEQARSMQRAFDAGFTALEVLAMLKDLGGFDGLKKWRPTVDEPEEGTPYFLPFSTNDDGVKREPPPVAQPGAGGRLPPTNDGPLVTSAEPHPEPNEGIAGMSIEEILERFLLVDVGPLDEDHHVFQIDVWQRRHMILMRTPDEKGLVMFRGTFDASVGLLPRTTDRIE